MFIVRTDSSAVFNTQTRWFYIRLSPGGGRFLSWGYRTGTPIVVQLSEEKQGMYSRTVLPEGVLIPRSRPVGMSKSYDDCMTGSAQHANSARLLVGLVVAKTCF